MSSPPPILVVGTGVANTASVLVALRRLGCEPRLATDPEEIRHTDRVVLPGVGAFAAAMDKLRKDGMAEPLLSRMHPGLPTLAICLGLHLLCEGSEESPGHKGLGLLPIRVRRFPHTVRVPQLGWNRVTPGADCQLLAEGHAYFANSYRVTEVPEGWAGSTSDHGGPYVAALERGGILACQFHPELSAQYGRDLLSRWLEKEPAPC